MTFRLSTIPTAWRNPVRPDGMSRSVRTPRRGPGSLVMDISRYLALYTHPLNHHSRSAGRFPHSLTRPLLPNQSGLFLQGEPRGLSQEF